MSSVPSTEPGAQLVPNRCLWKRNREGEGRREAEGREREKRRRREERKADQPVLGFATASVQDLGLNPTSATGCDLEQMAQLGPEPAPFHLFGPRVLPVGWRCEVCLPAGEDEKGGQA